MTDLADLIDPMPGKIAVLIATRDEITPQGLLIPYETARSLHEGRAVQGTVVAIGEPDPDFDDDEELSLPPRKLKLGDHVVFSKFTGTKITWQPDRTKERQEVLIMMEGDVLAIIRNPDEAKNLKVRQ